MKFLGTCCCFLALSAASGATRPGAHRSHVALAAGSVPGARRESDMEGREQGTGTLRVCNAYAFSKPLSIFHTVAPDTVRPFANPPAEEDLTGSSHLSFKQCEEFSDFRAGRSSRLTFKLSTGMEIGNFVVDGGAAPDCVLLVVIYRQDRMTTTADFSSHVFRNSAVPEVAFVDAYQGLARSALELRDLSRSGVLGDPEAVPFDSVLTLPAAERYEWRLLTDGAGRPRHTVSRGVLRTRRGQKYVAIRVGVDGVQGPSYDEELVLFPPQPRDLSGCPGALRLSVLVPLALTLRGF